MASGPGWNSGAGMGKSRLGRPVGWARGGEAGKVATRSRTSAASCGVRALWAWRGSCRCRLRAVPTVRGRGWRASERAEMGEG